MFSSRGYGEGCQEPLRDWGLEPYSVKNYQIPPGTLPHPGQFWEDEVCRARRVLVVAFPQPISGQVWEYVQGVGRLLEADVNHVETADEFEALCGASDGPTLIVLGSQDHPVLGRLLAKQADPISVGEQTDARWTALVAQQPRWPLANLLLILCGEETDKAAVEWTVRLACPAGSAVTVLAVVAPVPFVESWRGCMDKGLPALLTTDTALGRWMQHVAGHLVEKGIPGTLRLRQGPPGQQIHQEVIEGGYDLIVMAAAPCHRWQRWFKEDWPGSLFRWANRPVLVAGLG